MGGAGGSSVLLLVESPFLLLFRRLGDAALLASRFDMEEKAEEHVPNYVNTACMESVFAMENLESGVRVIHRA